ncbi:MAG: tetratricopeptide repeat protein, partial [Elusimicrobia bacterium]|nr:tetratricopeptide repeat protein [Elusimicrobiota bacterium]
AEKAGRTEEARACYAQAVSLDSRSSQAHYNWAVTFWNRDWDQAVRHMREAAALDPKNEQIRNFLGKAILAQKDLAKTR